MAGRNRDTAPGGWLGVCALLACNVASLAYFIRSFLDHRRRRRTATRPVANADVAIRPHSWEHYFTLAPGAVLNLELGDPTMYEPFWRAVGPRATTVIPGSDTMSYFSDAGAGELCWFLEPEFERAVRRLHRVVGNAAVDDQDGGGYHFVVGNGATQLFQAAMYALSCDADDDAKPVPVVSAAPYYSTNLQLSGHFRWAGDANAFTGENYIELVCSPNNPDGAVREAALSSSGTAKLIHDLVYYWPQYTAITVRAAHDIMLFTLSKITGHAGTRIGWALVRDRDVARKMVYFVDRSTIGVSKDSQLRATKILGVVSDAYELPHAAGAPPRLFGFARRRLAERWRALRAAVAASSGAFSLQEETSGYCNFAKQTVAACPAFAWLRCDKDGVEDCAAFLAGLKIVARGGEQFGGDARCVRINMMDRDQVFDLLVRRIASLKIEQPDYLDAF
ncbi:hypothetical protein PR202_ga11407 [Eleusine coracana subsp. coracana]|uniref:Alliinase C-terminal domain-containing protein n=1 Tax=Eleusine coracana subsp. coracana TaxID=191504 RepID=A0AAV5C9H9_ELECO|nr:hypothetical protein PR202_ga11407 [Eleusine coracana subsp. coracana]